MEAQILNLKGQPVGKVELPETVFGVKPRPTFLHEAVTIYETNLRSGTAHTKTRSEVRGGGRKPWKQKHTGRARHGSIRSPLWRKGGVVFGPRTRSYKLSLPPAKAHLALVQALSMRVLAGGLRVIDGLALDGAKTKQVAQMLKDLKADPRSLIVTEQHDENLARASRNIGTVKVMLVAHLNAYEVLARRNLIITKAALEKIAPRFNG
ncbi:MAG: 50S ribosomal protein L4 [Elusimicrobiota bacterium]|jgi:large subunit ribosomal protein L4